MNPGFPADFSEDADDSKEVAAEIIKIEEKRLGRKLTKEERQRILESVTPPRLRTISGPFCSQSLRAGAG